MPNRRNRLLVEPIRRGLIPAGMLTLFSGCSDSEPIEITGERELAASEREIRMVSSDAERFRAAAEPASGGARESVISFDYELPEGWQEAPRTGMRELNFTFGKSGEGEAYLTLLPGTGGGLEANVNRWRGQMGLEPATAGEIAALPKRKLFGREATYVSLDGDFRGVGASEAKEGYRMLGVILWNEQVGSIFAKMTGPKDLIEAHTENFETFCETIRPAGG